jgi:hypothetical protein
MVVFNSGLLSRFAGSKYYAKRAEKGNAMGDLNMCSDLRKMRGTNARHPNASKAHAEEIYRRVHYALPTTRPRKGMQLEDDHISNPAPFSRTSKQHQCPSGLAHINANDRRGGDASPCARCRRFPTPSFTHSALSPRVGHCNAYAYAYTQTRGKVY